MLTWDLVLRLVVGGTLLAVGVVTGRAAWLGLRGHLRPRRPAGADAAFVAGARVAGPPMLLAGAIAVAGAPAAALQPTRLAMFTVFGIVVVALLAIGWATRPLVHKAAAMVRVTEHADCRQPDCASACATCPFQAETARRA